MDFSTYCIWYPHVIFYIAPEGVVVLFSEMPFFRSAYIPYLLLWVIGYPYSASFGDRISISAPSAFRLRAAWAMFLPIIRGVFPVAFCRLFI